MYAVYKFKNAITKEWQSVLFRGRRKVVMKRENALATILNFNPDFNPIMLDRVGFYSRKGDIPEAVLSTLAATIDDVVVTDKFNKDGHYIWPRERQRDDAAPYFKYVDGIWRKTDYIEKMLDSED